MTNQLFLSNECDYTMIAITHHMLQSEKSKGVVAISNYKLEKCV